MEMFSSTITCGATEVYRGGHETDTYGPMGVFLSISMISILKCDSLYLSGCIVGHVVSIPSFYFDTLRQSDYIQTNWHNPS